MRSRDIHFSVVLQYLDIMHYSTFILYDALTECNQLCCSAQDIVWAEKNGERVTALKLASNTTKW